MPTVWQHLATPPALPGLFVRAALRRGIRGQQLPNLGLRAELSVDPKHLTQYRQVCEIANSAYLPAAYPHILAFPLQMQLLTDARFPLPLLGLYTWKTVYACCAPSAALGPLLSASSLGHCSPTVRAACSA